MAKDKHKWPEWRFDRYRHGNKMAEGIKVHAPNYEAAHAKAMGLADAGDSIVLDEAASGETIIVNTGDPKNIRLTGVENDPESPSAILAKKEAMAIYEHVAGDPEIYEALFALMSHESDALPQRQAFDVAFTEISENLDAAVAAVQKVDQILAEAGTICRDLRRIAARPPEPDIAGGELEAALMHIEAVSIMQAATSRLWRFIEWWAQVPVQAEGWEHFREDAANQLNSFR